MTEKDPKDCVRIGAGYPLAQLAKALSSESGERVRKWREVLAGMLDGSLEIGSRKPVAELPTWVTLEVTHGGFATGKALAGGELLAHEIKWLERIEGPGADREQCRARLNAYFLSDSGRGHLLDMAEKGAFRIDIPEEAATMVLAWLVANGRHEAAGKLVDEILPYCDRLRFYPRPADPMDTGELKVFVCTVSQTVSSLGAIEPSKRIETMRETLTVWNPLYDRIVELFLVTVRGKVPKLREDAAGELVRGNSGQPKVAGGWPCRDYPEGWAERGRELLADYAAARRAHQLSTKPDRPNENFCQLRALLQECLGNPHGLDGKRIGRIRRLLARYVSRHGEPGSDRWRQTRDAQARDAGLPSHASVAELVARRFDGLAGDRGVDDVDELMVPLDEREALGVDGKASAGDALPRAIATKIERSFEGSYEELIERKLIGSAEVLASLLPALTGTLRSGAIRDWLLARLYVDCYSAFSRRRSLLLINLESQVRFEELPWVEAMETERLSVANPEISYRLGGVVALALRSFPEVITPNVLVRELEASAGAAGLELDVVAEIAADIFVGRFSQTFLGAAKTAGSRLHDSIYARYFGIDYEEILALDDVRKSRAKSSLGKRISPGFEKICRRMALQGKGNAVVANGCVLEQAQILTTHNLAVLFEAFGLESALHDELESMAQRCLSFAASPPGQSLPPRAALQRVKNQAFAWRQMLFFLSLLEANSQGIFLCWAGEHLGEKSEDFQRRFAPAMRGLRRAQEGIVWRGDEGDPPRFLGWSPGPHWLVPGS